MLPSIRANVWESHTLQCLRIIIPIHHNHPPPHLLPPPPPQHVSSPPVLLVISIQYHRVASSTGEKEPQTRNCILSLSPMPPLLHKPSTDSWNFYCWWWWWHWHHWLVSIHELQTSNLKVNVLLLKSAVLSNDKICIKLWHSTRRLSPNCGFDYNTEVFVAKHPFLCQRNDW